MHVVLSLQVPCGASASQSLWLFTFLGVYTINPETLYAGLALLTQAGFFFQISGHLFSNQEEHCKGKSSRWKTSDILSK